MPEIINKTGEDITKELFLLEELGKEIPFTADFRIVLKKCKTGLRVECDEAGGTVYYSTLSSL